MRRCGASAGLDWPHILNHVPAVPFISFARQAEMEHRAQAEAEQAEESRFGGLPDWKASLLRVSAACGSGAHVVAPAWMPILITTWHLRFFVKTTLKRHLILDMQERERKKWEAERPQRERAQREAEELERFNSLPDWKQKLLVKQGKAPSA